MIIVFDIDGTLANINHRLGYVRTKPKNWKAFDAGIPNDLVNTPVQRVFQTLSTGNTIILASGRSDRTRKDTVNWLERNDLGNFDQLYMRKNGDFRSDDVIKKEILDQIIIDWGKPDMVFDDRPKVVNMWRENGIWVFDCNQSGKDF